MASAGVVFRRWWRALAVVVVTALLAVVPAVVASLPVSDSSLSARALLAEVRGSASIAFSGLAQSQGNLGLPNLPKTGATSDLLGGIVRLREWWAGPTRWRVDQLNNDGETDSYPEPEGSLQWDSLSDTVTRTFGVPRVHQPTALDLTPPALGRRLAAGDTGSTLTRIGARRVAGHDVYGVRIVPPAAQTTVGHIDIWVTAAGLPVQVDVVAATGGEPAVSTTFLALQLGPPAVSTTSFTPPPGAQFSALRSPDYVAAADAGPSLQLPNRLISLPRTALIGPIAQSGVATFGRGFALVSVIPLPYDVFHQAIDALQPPIGTDIAGNTARLETLPLFTVVVGYAPMQQVPYLVVGTVSAKRMTAAAEAIAREPARPHTTLQVRQ